MTYYTRYQATQQQRKIERAIRKQKTHILVDEGTGDTEKLQSDQIKLGRLREEYKRFSSATGLRTQYERIEVAGFGRGQAARATAVVRQQEKRYNKVKEDLAAQIASGELPLALNVGNQNKHIPVSKGFIDGRSFIYGGLDEAQALVAQYSGTGEFRLTRAGDWSKKEFITTDRIIGVIVDPVTNEETQTHRFSIHYGKRGTHVVPAKEVEPK